MPKGPRPRFTEKAWWLCASAYAPRSIIGGGLAQVLKRHSEFGLLFIGYDDEDLKRWHGKQHPPTVGSCQYCYMVLEALHADKCA